MGEGDKDRVEKAPDRGSTCAQIMPAQLSTLGDFFPSMTPEQLGDFSLDHTMKANHNPRKEEGIYFTSICTFFKV